MLISVLILPGSGARDVTLAVGTTVRQFLDTNPDWRGRQVVLNGRTLETSDYGRTLASGDEVALLATVKGA